MDSNYLISVVEDDVTSRLLMQSMLGDKYAVEVFDAAEGCLARIEQQLPNLFLLDVGLPGIDGYELCRRIKSKPGAQNIPIIFISGHDSPEDIMAGYEAGGHDYVAKPFNVFAFAHKIENLRRIEEEKRALLSQTQSSDELATLVLANLDEYALLIKFLRNLNECRGHREVVEALLQTLTAYHLDAAIQIRMRHLEKTFSKTGENWPLEIAVINHVRSLDRIFEFKQRAAFNFEHLTVLVTNMPISDVELCGRIRDNIAIAAESADAKLAALQAVEDKARMREDIAEVVKAIGREVESCNHRYDEARYRGALFTSRFLDDLLASFAHLGMTGEQEEEILNMVKDRANRLVDLYDVAGSTQETLSSLSKRLEAILETSSQPGN